MKNKIINCVVVLVLITIVFATTDYVVGNVFESESLWLELCIYIIMYGIMFGIKNGIVYLMKRNKKREEQQ
ncbi:MAG: hypothetical protein E7284_12235 [Lachnospiraceae bacterium]|nr:hypothetical protein [Lachnospiraceae bacterium]